MSTCRRSRAGRGEAGAVLLELAMVAPLLVALTLVIIDLGSVLDSSVGFRNGVREAAWAAGRGLGTSPAPPACTPFWEAGAPTLDDGTAARVVCRAKQLSGLPADAVRVRVRRLSVLGADAVMVCAMRRTTAVTRFLSPFLDGVQRVRTTTVVVGDPARAPIDASESAFGDAPGGWGFCDPQAPVPAGLR